MEENQDTSLFGLSIDATTKDHLSETARWARFLSILGFVGIGLIALFVLLAGLFGGIMSSEIRTSNMGAAGMMGGSFQFIFLILMIALYFFPCLFLFRFATKMKTALATNDQEVLNTSFQNLKKLFRFIGILTIILLAFYAIILVFVLGAGIGRM